LQLRQTDAIDVHDWLCNSRKSSIHFNFHIFLKEYNTMSDENATASAAHKEAAAQHKACAEHHTKAASCHDNHKIDDAKASAKSAMSCCDKANQKTATACGCSAK
jgi:lipid A disaccharide synthetase